MSVVSEVRDAFIAARPELRIWRDYPNISQADGDLTDAWACHQVSDEFARFAADRGVHALRVTASRFADPWIGEHAWTVLLHSRRGRWHVDFTARQFHNIDGPGAERALTGVWPLTWPAPTESHWHPIAGGFTTITIDDYQPSALSHRGTAADPEGTA